MKKVLESVLAEAGLRRSAARILSALPEATTVEEILETLDGEISLYTKSAARAFVCVFIHLIEPLSCILPPRTVDLHGPAGIRSELTVKPFCLLLLLSSLSLISHRSLRSKA